MELILAGEEKSAVREEHGFRRTEWRSCAAPCRHIPGGLDPADLPRLCPQGQDVFAWAEQHLRAVTGRPYPTLVPARGPDGACHWYFAGRCAVHGNAPYGCAFFDSHLPGPEVERRYAATVAARRQEAATDGLYSRVWLHLCKKGLVGTVGDGAALTADWQRLQRAAVRGRRRAQSP